ncbi:carbapenem biosynthesis protein CpmH [Symbiopectobacterium purcellii]|uniref:carbapenem biosynthesis protein CpmH n=1 Tax=Symbiopectobacterium purcellii TaxID=2871826 RepID=UPI0020766CDC|nr:carbapenem biosynthesis protein CpmH [Symbiopectobacterium purcellii]
MNLNYALILLLSWAALFPGSLWAQPTNADYQRALRDYFAAEPAHCLGVKQWPVYSHAQDAPWITGRMQALVDAGLARETRQGENIVYQLTPQAEQAWRTAGDLCFGRMELDHILTIEPVAQGMNAVYFTYRLTQLAPWASNASLRFAFSEMNNLIAGSTKMRYSATFRITKQSKLMLHSPPIPVELDF